MFTRSTSKNPRLRLLSWDGVHAGSSFVGSKGKEKWPRKMYWAKSLLEDCYAFLARDSSRQDICSHPQHKDSVQASPPQPLLERNSVYSRSRGQQHYWYLPFPTGKYLWKNSLSQVCHVNDLISNPYLKQAYRIIYFIIKKSLVRLKW